MDGDGGSGGTSTRRVLTGIVLLLGGVLAAKALLFAALGRLEDENECETIECRPDWSLTDASWNLLVFAGTSTAVAVIGLVMVVRAPRER